MLVFSFSYKVHHEPPPTTVVPQTAPALVDPIPSTSTAPSPPPFPPASTQPVTTVTSSPQSIVAASTSTSSPPPFDPTHAGSLTRSPVPSTSSELPPLIIPLSTPPPPPQEPIHDLPLTRSQKKIKLFEKYETEVEGAQGQDSSCVRTIVEMPQFRKLIHDLKLAVICPECQSGRGLDMEIERQLGLALKLNIVCVDCSKCIASHYTSSRNEQSTSSPQPFVVNETTVFASLLAGMGPSSFKNFCEFLEMPGMHHKTFNRIASRIYSRNEALGDSVFGQAASIVRKEHDAHYNLHLQDDDILNISVSFDGSWLTRGHKSLVGIGCVIDMLTGLVLDVHVLNMHCTVCARTGEWIRKETPQNFEKWLADHKASGLCATNYQGTSGMMEVKAAEVLWSRSIEKYKIRYTTMVSDGDSKSYNRLLELQPYGPQFQVEKEDCLNHVGKRMGSALRNLVADASKRGTTLGGRGHGRLTGETIRKLQIYYTRAIRGNKSAEEMRKAILASLYHGYSTDDYPQHQYCPPGLSSWCFYKRTIANHQYPSGHRQRVHTPLDKELLHSHLEPLYKRLTSDDLLRRCEQKSTQNPNESFHHSVWSRCPKKNLHSLKRVQFAIITAAAEYNRGPEAISSIKRSLSMDVGMYGKKFSKARQQKRVQKSISEATEKAKQRRKLRAAAKAKAHQEKEAEEGGPAYQPGMF